MRAGICKTILCIYLIFLISTELLYGQFHILDVHPSLHSITAHVYESIQVRFNALVDTTDILKNFFVWGEQSGSYPGIFKLTNQDSVVLFSPSMPFKAGEKIEVILTQNMKSRNNDLLDHAFQWSFWIGVYHGEGEYDSIIQYDLHGGREPVDICCADFDGDSYIEVATANNASNSVTVLKNSFSTRQNYYNGQVYDVGDGPIAITSGDLNGDGYADIVTSNLFSNDLSLLINNTQGSFTINHLTITERPIDVVIKDFNNDGNNDIAVLGFGNDELIILVNQGGGSFNTPYIYATDEGPTSMVSFDFDQDGDKDIGVACWGGQDILIFENSGLGQFNKADTRSLDFSPSFLDAANIFQTDNGDVELICLSQNTNLMTILNRSSNTYHVSQEISVQTMPIGAVCCDFDGGLSQDFDLVLASFISEDITLYRNSGSHIVTPYFHYYDTQNTPSSICQGDVDRDGDIDILVTNLTSDRVGLFRNLWDYQGAQPLLDFNSVCVGDSPIRSFQFINTFNLIVNIDTIYTLGNSSVFQTNCLPQSVFPGDTIEFQVSFTPLDTLAYMGTLFLETNNPFQPNINVILRGNGIQTILLVYPDSLDFGGVPPGYERTLHLEISNIGNVDCEVQIENAEPCFYTNYPSFILTPHGPTVEIPIIFKPQQVSFYSDSLLFINNTCPEDTTIVYLEGDGSWNSPEIISDSIWVMVEHVYDYYRVEAVDPENSPITYRFERYPTWLTPIGSDTIHGIPPEGAVDTSFLAIASNGPLSDSLKVHVLVTPVNDPPELVEWISPQNHRVLFQDTTIDEDELLEFFVYAKDPENSIVNLSMDTVFTPRPKGAIFIHDSTNRARFSWKPPFGSVGTYFIIFKGVENSGSPPLSDMDTVRISVEKLKPDLYINNFFTPKTNVYIQETIWIEAEVGNERAPINQSFDIRFIKNSVIVKDTTITAGLDTGEVVSVKQKIQFLELGNHKITVEADYKNNINEEYEINNDQTITISVDEGHLLVRPNPFTPNRDGYNDYVEFDFSQLVLGQPKLKIFNFSGSVVVTYDWVSGQRFVWYGLNGSGKELSPGVYLYALYDGDKIVHTGSIVLAR